MYIRSAHGGGVAASPVDHGLACDIGSFEPVTFRGTRRPAGASGRCAPGGSRGLATEGAPAMSTPSRFLGIGVALGLAAGLLVGTGLTGPGRAAAAAPSATPSGASSGVAIGAPAALPPIATGGGTVTASGSAIAYPYFGGSPGVAPDHTIVVTGVGQADLQSDGSNQAAAQNTALGASLADAKAQADVIAADTGLSINGVLSVSASVSPGYGVMPLVANGAGRPTCVMLIRLPQRTTRSLGRGGRLR
jgi:hypothetical protein